MNSDKNIVIPINNTSIFSGDVFDIVKIYRDEGFGTIEPKVTLVYKRQSDNLQVSFSLKQAMFFTVNGSHMTVGNLGKFDLQKIPLVTDEYLNKIDENGINIVDSFTVLKGNDNSERHHPNLDINQPIFGIGNDWMKSSIEKVEKERLDRIAREKSYITKREKENWTEKKKNEFESKALELRTNILEYVNSRKSSGFFGIKKTMLEKKVYQLAQCVPQNFVGEINWDLSSKEVFNYKVMYNREGGGIQVFRLGDLLHFWVKDNFTNQTTVLYDYLSPVFENITRFNRDNLWMHLIPAQLTIVSVEDIKDERGNVIYHPYSYKKFHERKEELKALNLPYSFSDIFSDSEFKKNLSGTSLMPTHPGTFHSAKIEVSVIIQNLFDPPIYLD